MWPWGHLAVGYLLYSYVQKHTVLKDKPVLALLLGTQFPDIVDKPLAWTFTVLPTGRTLGHSLLITGILVFIVYRFTVPGSRQRELLGVFGLGYLSHLAADALLPIIEWELQYLSFLIWPLVQSPTYETAPSFSAHLASIELTPFFIAQLVLAGMALRRWLKDGMPGARIR